MATFLDLGLQILFPQIFLNLNGKRGAKIWVPLQVWISNLANNKITCIQLNFSKKSFFENFGLWVIFAMQDRICLLCSHLTPVWIKCMDIHLRLLLDNNFALLDLKIENIVYVVMTKCIFSSPCFWFIANTNLWE